MACNVEHCDPQTGGMLYSLWHVMLNSVTHAQNWWNTKLWHVMLNSVTHAQNWWNTILWHEICLHWYLQGRAAGLNGRESHCLSVAE